jgi:hypothetical protein
LLLLGTMLSFGGVDDQVIKSRQKKLTRLIREEDIPCYDVWNHIKDVDPSTSELSDHRLHQNNGSFIVGGSSSSGSIGNSKVNGWCQLECWLKCENIHITDKYYARANRRGKRAIRRVSSVFSPGNSNSIHAGLNSASSFQSVKSSPSFSNSDSTSSNIGNTAKGLLNDSRDQQVVYVEVYMSKPSTAPKDLLFAAAIAEKIEMEYIDRTEECVGSEDPIFSVLVLLDFPMDITVVNDSLDISEVCKALGIPIPQNDDGSDGSNVGKRGHSSSFVGTVDRVVRIVVKVRAGAASKTVKEYGRSHCMVSDLVRKAKNSQKLDSDDINVGDDDVDSTTINAVTNRSSTISTVSTSSGNRPTKWSSLASIQEQTTMTLNVDLPSRLIAKNSKSGLRDLSNSISNNDKNVPKLILAPRWCQYACRELASCRNLSSAGYSVGFFSYLTDGEDEDDEKDAIGKNREMKEGTDEGEDDDDDDEDDENVVELTTDALAMDTLLNPPSTTDNNYRNKSNDAVRKNTSMKRTQSNKSIRERRSRSRTTASRSGGRKNGEWITMGLREELTEAFTTFETPTGWVRLRLKEWENDYSIASTKLSNLELQEKNKNSNNATKNTINIKFMKKLMKKLSSIIDRYKTLADTYWVLHKSAAHCDPRGWQPLTFKASTKKGDRELAFVPINLHTQLFTMSESPTWLEATRNSDPARRVIHDFITVGLPSAHTMSFDEYGLESMRNELFGENSDGSGSGSGSRGKIGTTTTSTLKNVGKNHDLKHDITTAGDDDNEMEVDIFDIINVRLREDIVFSQMLSAVVESFSNKIYLAASEERNRREYKEYQQTNGWVEEDVKELNDENRIQQLEIMFRAGWLVSLESLVTSQGNERGMLEDAVQAIESLKRVELMVVLKKNDDNEDEEEDKIKETNEGTEEINSMKKELKVENNSKGSPKGSHNSNVHSPSKLDIGKRRKKRARSSMIHPMFMTLLNNENQLSFNNMDEPSKGIKLTRRTSSVTIPDASKFKRREFFSNENNLNEDLKGTSNY